MTYKAYISELNNTGRPPKPIFDLELVFITRLGVTQAQLGTESQHVDLILHLAPAIAVSNAFNHLVDPIARF
jgi:hypothetical protein